MKKIAIIGATALLASTSALSSLPGTTVAAKTATKYVDIKDNPATEGEFWYLPKKLTVKVGTKVVWRNRSSQPHSVTDQEAHPLFDSGNVDHLIQPGQRWAHVFHHVATFTYYCIIHPGMKGKILVTR